MINTRLFLTAAQRLVEVDNALYLRKAVGGLRKLCAQQCLAGGEHFQVGGSAVLH